jgi:transporter family protein
VFPKIKKGVVMTVITQPWFLWSLGSALFAALTAILAKVGVEGIDSDLATFIRTVIVTALLGLLLFATGKLHAPASIAPRTYLFLGLSGVATGASWLCYFRALQLGDAARVAPVDKLSVVLVTIFAVLFLGERLSTLNWTGVCLIAAGVILVAYKG